MKFHDKDGAMGVLHIRSNSTWNDCLDNRGLPPGRIIAGRRLWTDVELIEWALRQPSEKLPLKGKAKELAEQKRGRE
jgi:hypothetical protein